MNGDVSTPEAALFPISPPSTSQAAKLAMVQAPDASDPEVSHLVQRIRRSLLMFAGVDNASYKAILLPGAGAHGADRGQAGISHVRQSFPETRLPSVDAVDRVLASIPEITHVAAVHCEPPTGIFNPVGAIGALSQRRFRFRCISPLARPTGFVIHRDTGTEEPCFRIGAIGQIGDAEIERLLTAISYAMTEMGMYSQTCGAPAPAFRPQRPSTI